MPAVAEMLKASEAAVVSRVSLRRHQSRHRRTHSPRGPSFRSTTVVISWLGPARSSPSISKAPPSHLGRTTFAIPDGRGSTSKSAHRSLAGFVARGLDCAPRVPDDRSYALYERCERTAGRLAAAREIVTSSPEILGGTPVVRGSRVPVYDVAASQAAGHSTERILETWPSLDAEKIRLASIYAEANPLRPAPRLRRPSRRLGHHHRSSRPPSQENGMKYLIDECLSPETGKNGNRKRPRRTSHVVWMKLGGLKDWEL